MNGLTILEVITTAEETHWLSTIIIVVVLAIIGWFFFLLGFSYMKTESNAGIFLCFSVAFICLIGIAVVTDYPPKKKVDLGYEQIIAYVDLSVTSEEQIKEKYEIISKNGDIYTLRKKEEITEDVIQNKHVHQWEVIDANKKKDETEYTIECADCKQKRQISN